jgi:hypothetical protein
MTTTMVSKVIYSAFFTDCIIPTLTPTVSSSRSSGSDVAEISFYNGCAPAPNVGDVLSEKHATSTIHLRLANSDDILQQSTKDDIVTTSLSVVIMDATTTDAEQQPPPKKMVDLLVQRLNDFIQKALDECSQWDETVSDIVVSPEVDTQAQEIKELESQVEDVWIQDHALIDEDGRARCSFHFCRKLFKDDSFLKKHLMKKHCEFLRAEMAKCYDSYMMKAWDAQEVRPVPPILVDCGRAVIPSPVIGAAQPMAADPEPDLWRRQEERRKQEEKEEQAQRERYNSNHSNNNNHHHNGGGGGASSNMNGPLSEDRTPPRSHNFVDVDDMKEEKVEINFDNIEVPVLQPPTKKRKKKKLLWQQLKDIV